MPLVPHLGFVVATYVVAALTVAGLIGWVLADHRAQRRVLAELEARGMTRHSARDAA